MEYKKKEEAEKGSLSISEPKGIGVSRSRYEVGTIAKRPICVSFRWAKINGKFVAFYHVCSEVNDSVKVEKWIKKVCNPKTVDKREAWVDAMNFHNCVIGIEQLIAKGKKRENKK